MHIKNAKLMHKTRQRNQYKIKNHLQWIIWFKLNNRSTRKIINNNRDTHNSSSFSHFSEISIVEFRFRHTISEILNVTLRLEELIKIFIYVLMHTDKFFVVHLFLVDTASLFWWLDNNINVSEYTHYLLNEYLLIYDVLEPETS